MSESRATWAGPDYTSAWRTLDEKAFLDGLGTHSRAIATPATRRMLVRMYLDALPLRVLRGSVDWRAVEAYAQSLMARIENL